MQQPADLGTVLLVDDYLPLLRNMAFLLELTGFHALTATNGAEALALMEAQTPDLIISDIEMPLMNGFEFLSTVRADARWQSTPFILASAHYELDDVLHSLDLGADDYVPKPFDIYDVLDSIHRTAPFVAAHSHPIAS
ncbi:MAG: response regulator [Anaerolineae bacterium]|nr:response regulator [Anaerolineae bacterium]